MYVIPHRSQPIIIWGTPFIFDLMMGLAINQNLCFKITRALFRENIAVIACVFEQFNLLGTSQGIRTRTLRLRVVMMPTLSLVAPNFVVMKTSGAANDNKVINMTTPIVCSAWWSNAGIYRRDRICLWHVIVQKLPEHPNSINLLCYLLFNLFIWLSSWKLYNIQHKVPIHADNTVVKQDPK